jgi:hypothetical protein
MNLLMARPAETHEVRLIIGAALREGNNVMDFLDGDVASFLQTHLAERMLVNVTITDAFPCATVSFAGRITACELLVVLLH